MKLIRTGAAVAIVLVAYAAWPIVGLKAIADAVDARDAAALAERIDGPRLKRSLIDQIALAYLKASGKDKNLTPLQLTLALQIAAALADSRVEDMLKPDSLLALLDRTGTTGYSGGNVGLPRLQGPNLRNLFHVLRTTQYDWLDFYMLVPFEADETTGYRIRLRLSDWTWKLAGIALPEHIKQSIAQELTKKSP